MPATYAVTLTSGNRIGLGIRRAALGAAIIVSLAGAIVGGVLFGRAVTSPANTVSEPAAQRAPASAERVEARTAPARKPRSSVWPALGAVGKAREIAAARSGVVSFAAIGPGRTAGFEADRQFFSASVTKALLLVAELRRLRREEAVLDDATRSLLEQMITLSDNEAADAIYARVGDAGLNEVAEAAGMSRFSGDVGHWSNAQITATDMALFMSRLDELLNLPGGRAGSKLLASVHPTQSWGVPDVAPDGARVRLKGGWRPSDSGQLVHQAARVDMDDKSYALAILTDGNPSMSYGEKTIRLIAAALLASDPPTRRSASPGS